MKIEFKINFESRNTSIREQIKSYGLKFDLDRVVHFESLRKSVNQLLASEILIPEIAIIAFERIYNQILHHIKVKNNLSFDTEKVEEVKTI